MRKIPITHLKYSFMITIQFNRNIIVSWKSFCEQKRDSVQTLLLLFAKKWLYGSISLSAAWKTEQCNYPRFFALLITPTSTVLIRPLRQPLFKTMPSRYSLLPLLNVTYCATQTWAWVSMHSFCKTFGSLSLNFLFMRPAFFVEHFRVLK